MASLTWLHLSDWHQKGPDFDRKVVRDALVHDIRDRGAIDPRLAEVGFVVFSGDLANGGKKAEYEAAREQLLDPVLKEAQVAREQLLIVPGNHDLDRDDLELVPQALSKPLGSNEEVQQWLTDTKRRSRALEPFSQFHAFVSEYTGQTSPDFANLLRFDIGGRTVAILGLNSAWMCGRNKNAKGEVDDNRHLVLGEPQIHDALEAMSDADVRIAVLHHPWEWLATWDRERVQDRIQRASHFVLVGHVHRPRVNVSKGTGGDYVEVPGGASYDRRTASDPLYTNAYNWIHLDFDTGQGTVLLRRWSESQTAWIEDTDVYAGGRFDFDLPKDLATAKQSVPAPTSPAARIDAEAQRRADAEKRYRKLLLETCDIVNLANLPEQDRHIAERRLELRRLYVPLRVHVEAASGKEEDAKLWEKLEDRRTSLRRGRDEEVPQGELQRISVGERLAAGSRLIVLGDPGAGKTTLTRWIATAYLLRLTQDPGWREVPDISTLPDRDWLPIIVRCRDLDPKCLAGTLDDILDHTLRKAELSPDEAGALKNVLRERLHAGKALLLLDGLDEINDPGARARFCSQLEQIAVAYPDAPILATSRIVGYREMGYRLGRGFEHLTLADLAHEEKDDFARRWCALIELPERREAAAADMIHDIHSSERIERLTGNPMLLTTLALVKRKVVKLPSRRADLYNEAVQVMLHWRREVDAPLDPYEAIPQLEYLAYAMCDRGVQRLRREEVLDLLRQMREESPNLYAVKARSPEDFLRRVESRTALLMETGRVKYAGAEEPVYEFRHLTFQEYLAARALVNKRFPGRDSRKTLAENVALLAGRTETQKEGRRARHMDVGVVEAWREALRLCIAICPDDDVDGILQAVITPQADEMADTARARAILGALCLADEPNASVQVANQVLDTFAGVIREKDGQSYTGASAAVMDLAPTRWAPALVSNLVQAFCWGNSAFRSSVGGLAGRVIGESISRDPIDLKNWLTKQIKRLRSADEPEIAGAALGVMQIAFLNLDIDLSGLDDALLEQLSGGAAMTHAASWALGWMNYPRPEKPVWHPTATQARRLVEFVANRTAAPEAVRFLCWIFRAEKVVEAAQPLIGWLDCGQTNLRCEVVRTLGELRSEAAVHPLIERLEDSNADVRSAAVDALVKIGGETGVTPLVECLKSMSKVVRSTAAYVLGKIGSEAGVQPLIKCLKDPEAEVRTAAAVSLGEMKLESAIDHLVERLGDQETEVRIAAAYSLGEIKSEATVNPLIERLDDPGEEMRGAAAHALGMIGSKAAIQPLINRLRDPAADVRNAAANALGEIGSETAINPILRCLEDLEAAVRSAAADALGRIGSDSAVKPLMNYLNDPELSVREAALRGLVTHVSQQGALLLSRDLDGEHPFLDPREPITDDHASRASGRLGLMLEETRALYGELAAHYSLKLAWRPHSS